MADHARSRMKTPTRKFDPLTHVAHRSLPSARAVLDERAVKRAAANANNPNSSLLSFD